MEPGFPMSYIAGEPAAMRGREFNYDPYKQITSRLQQLQAIGHEPSKVELVIQGGTFLAAPVDYQEMFVRRCLDALTGVASESLEDAKRQAEHSTVRNVGLTIETKPDWCKKSHVDQMLNFGATRVEIGVQVIDDRVYELTNRGHTVEDVVEAFRTSRDAGFKIVAHMMPGLPGSDFSKDLESFRALFEDPRFRPDMLKIYPCLVTEGTMLYDWWKHGSYHPYDTPEAVELIARVKEMVPRWVRIMRVHREFPKESIVAGVKDGNLRELALRRLTEKGKRCECIRCREVGHRALKENVETLAADGRITADEYEAGDGKEFFISFEDADSDVLMGYLRLRVPSLNAHRPEVGKSTAIIRELHVLGPEVPVGVEPFEGAWQHVGIGQLLLEQAEMLARGEGLCRIIVISALGTKAYYRRLGYSYVGPYMGKALD